MTTDSVPPPYKPSEDGLHVDNVSTKLHLPAGVKPSNFVRVSRPKAITGVWVIDPSMKMPVDDFPSSTKTSGTSTRSVGERQNIQLECTASSVANGSIAADIFVLPTSSSAGHLISSPVSGVQDSKRIAIMANSPGWMKLRLHDASPEAKSEDRLPIVAKAKSGGAMKLYLPKSFSGPLYLQAQKRVWYSSDVKAQLTPLSEVDQNHMAFLGNFEPNLWEGWQKWKGDSLSGDAGASSIDVYFDDEDYIPTTDSTCVCM